MSDYISEKEVLNKLHIDNFRQVTKDKVIALASMLDRMDPEVAQKALEQFPDFSKSITSIISDYKDVIKEGFVSNNESMKACYETCNTILESMRLELQNENLGYDQKREIMESMISVNKMLFDKDTENKSFVLKIVGEAAVVVIGAAIIMLSALGCNAKINVHS